ARGLPALRIGVVEAGGAAAVLDVQGHFAISLAELREVHEATLPAVFGG
ncbi:MAG: hypothetical protein ACRC0L_03070, partial [Angustibacter sp.]